MFGLLKIRRLSFWIHLEYVHLIKSTSFHCLIVRLEKSIVAASWSSIHLVDHILVLVDVSKEHHKTDMMLIEELLKFNLPLTLGLNMVFLY